ncbi:hypothetical protein [Terrisporobacter sp.]|nr:hypothetical protein [Terrisporobacter sp.]
MNNYAIVYQNRENIIEDGFKTYQDAIDYLCNNMNPPIEYFVIEINNIEQ